jgi:hypothetical protein
MATYEIQAYNRSTSAYGLARYNAAGHQFAVSGTEAARIDSSGRLLVGTSTARENFFNSTGQETLLQIEGTTNQTSRASFTRNSNDDNAPALIFGKTRSASVGGNTVVSSGDQIGVICFQGADGTELVAAAQIEALIDGTPGANDMPGRLVFSTTADGASSPTERMRLTAVGEFRQFTSSGGGTAQFASGNGASGNPFLTLSHSASGINGGTDSFRVNFNGDVRNTNNSYGAISDIKLKENIVDATSQWNDLKALQVRKYNFKEETRQETHTQIGLVAQEAELVSPGLVSESPDRDEDGNDLGTVTKSVNYSVLYMKAVKALQEAMERIEQLESKVAALESA